MVNDGETDEGTVLLCQTAGSPRAFWPITGQGWPPLRRRRPLAPPTPGGRSHAASTARTSGGSSFPP
eukprot:4617693-Lingulodinium_polyedra.AAC.1